jgi:hypothetical protein
LLFIFYGHNIRTAAITNSRYLFKIFSLLFFLLLYERQCKSLFRLQFTRFIIPRNDERWECWKVSLYCLWKLIGLWRSCFFSGHKTILTPFYWHKHWWSFKKMLKRGGMLEIINFNYDMRWVSHFTYTRDMILT